MMAHMEDYYSEKYPEAGFSVAWIQVECMAHVLNLGAQQIAILQNALSLYSRKLCDIGKGYSNL